jgi:hypothetical protein
MAALPPTEAAQMGQTYGVFVGVAVAVVILFLRNRRARALKIERLWIRPAIFLALLVLARVGQPPLLTPAAVAFLAGALVAGALVGWQRARFVRIDIHPETHELSSQASVWGVVFIAAVLLLRLWMRSALSQNASVLGLSPETFADTFLLFAVGMMVTYGLEIWIRARRMLAEAQAAKAAAGQPPI